VAALVGALSGGDARAQLFATPNAPGVWYFGGEGGWTNLENQSGTIFGTHLSTHYNSGFNVGARGGYQWGPWRFEEEFRFQQVGFDSVGIAPGPLLTAIGVCPTGSCPAHGNRNAYALMSNVIYDFDWGWAITPHIGAGIGAVDLVDGWGIPGVGTFGNSSNWQFGYQGIAGVRYNINPALAFDVDYRYLGTSGSTFTTEPIRVLNGARLSYDTKGISSHNVVASLTLRFGAPPPPPPPPVPPAPPPVMRKVFLVFFDWDKSTITPEGMQIVQQAAAAFQGGAPVTIQVTGYTDRSGSPGYNQRLSERRANAVASALVGLGVPRQAMVVAGRGENDNRVPTADGVREPQNRRVEIVFP
jgi:OmpA-OmpF porin, OOP family